MIPPFSCFHRKIWYKRHFHLAVENIPGLISQDTRTTTVRRRCNSIYVGLRDRNLMLRFVIKKKIEKCTAKRLAEASLPAFVVSASMYESTVSTSATEDHVTGTEREMELPLHLVTIRVVIPFFLKAQSVLSSSTFLFLAMSHLRPKYISV